MSPGIPAASLRCEYRANPLGINVPHPRFGWTVHSAASLPRGRRQIAYQILTASSPRLLDDDHGDLIRHRQDRIPANVVHPIPDFSLVARRALDRKIITQHRNCALKTCDILTPANAGCEVHLSIRLMTS